MKLSTIVIKRKALTKKGAMRKAEGEACRIFEKEVTKAQKVGLQLESAMVAPVKIERDWFTFKITYEVTGKVKEIKREPNCKVKACKKTAAKAKKKVYKK